MKITTGMETNRNGKRQAPLQPAKNLDKKREEMMEFLKAHPVPGRLFGDRK